MTELMRCPSCHRLTPASFLSEAHDYAFWRRPDGACPACVQALREQLSPQTPVSSQMVIGSERIVFTLLDSRARRVQVLGSWDDWQAPGLEMQQQEAGVWRAELPLPADGQYHYKFLVDGRRWLDDPANPRKAWDGFGGFNSVLALTDCPHRQRYHQLNDHEE